MKTSGWICILIHYCKGKLLHKYEGVHFQDENRNWNIVTGLELSGGCTKLGWTLVCENQSDGDVVSLLINDVINLIGVCVQPPELNLEIIVNKPQRERIILSYWWQLRQRKGQKWRKRKNKQPKGDYSNKQQQINI
jgi:hypothetical protein